MEIWLKYGSTEVVLDIKAENLLENIVFSLKPDEERVRKALDSINIGSNATIVILEPVRILVEFASMLAASLANKGVSVNIQAHHDMSIYRKIEPKIDLKPITAELDKRDTILLSLAGFDPLFGYTGTPVNLFSMNKERVLGLLKHSSKPEAGKRSDALSKTHEFVQHYESTAVEVIPASSGIFDLAIDTPLKAHEDAIKILEAAKMKIDRTKAAIISSGEANTLASAIKVLWNCIDVVREGGMMVLLAECRDGLGSDALEMLVEGKIGVSDLRKTEKYIEGMEDLLYLDWARGVYEIGIVTSLPDYYVRVLGLKPFRKVSDSLHYILNKYGARQKVVVSDGRMLLNRSDSKSLE